MNNNIIFVIAALLIVFALFAALQSETLVYEDESIVVYERLNARIVLPGLVLGVPAGEAQLQRLEMRRLRMKVLRGDMLQHGYRYISTLRGAGAWLEVEKEQSGGALFLAVPQQWKDYIEAILGRLGAGENPTEAKNVGDYYVVVFYGEER